MAMRVVAITLCDELIVFRVFCLYLQNRTYSAIPAEKPGAALISPPRL
jgi:hypothetical protein